MAVNFAQWGNDLYTGRRSYDIVGKRRVWLGLSALFVVLSVVVLLTKGSGQHRVRGGLGVHRHERVDHGPAARDRRCQLRAARRDGPRRPSVRARCASRPSR